MTPAVARGLELLGAGRAAECLAVIDRLPPDRLLEVQRAYACAMLGRIAQALQAARRAMASQPVELWALDLLGQTFTLCHCPHEAHAAFAGAARVAPGRPDVLFNLATAAGFLGRTDEAEQAYDRVIAADPDNAQAWLNRSLLRRQTPDANHLAPLRAALARATGQREVYLRHALGKELEDLGDHDGAFAAFARGAALRRGHMRYAVGEDIEAMRAIAATHDARWCGVASAAEGPIFIIGLPRSGSTLLERALGRHSQVQALGELQTFGQALVAALRDQRSPTDKLDAIRLSASIDPAPIGAAYLAGVAPLRDGRARFIDKLPGNFLYAGLIARVLPGARLVHIRRDPLDLCFAIFKTLFGDAYPWSYDLAELAAYHQAYRGLMDHWRQVLGERLVEVDYEALVGDPAETLGRVLAALGLGFEAACLNPEQDRGAVMTASAAQVRQPIHTASVGSAQRYRAHLGPLIAALEAS
jgi:tetratricopeptide (TPR) repeat protein